MKVVAVALAVSLGLVLSANAQTREPAAAAVAAPAAAAKKKPDAARDARADGPFCKWKGGDFSAGAEFCVFNGRSLLCENGVWKQMANPACIVTPATLP